MPSYKSKRHAEVYHGPIDLGYNTALYTLELVGLYCSCVQEAFSGFKNNNKKTLLKKGN